MLNTQTPNPEPSLGLNHHGIEGDHIIADVCCSRSQSSPTIAKLISMGFRACENRPIWSSGRSKGKKSTSTLGLAGVVARGDGADDDPRTRRSHRPGRRLQAARALSRPSHPKVPVGPLRPLPPPPRRRGRRGRRRLGAGAPHHRPPGGDGGPHRRARGAGDGGGLVCRRRPRRPSRVPAPGDPAAAFPQPTPTSTTAAGWPTASTRSPPRFSINLLC